MPHIVKPLNDVSFDDALRRLRAAHHFLVSRANETIKESSHDESRWGKSLKRSFVRLSGDDQPKLIGKPEEKFTEIINIVATLERLIDALDWFSKQPQNKGYKIRECHPSTSDEKNGNDLVIVDSRGNIAIRCEVCDVVSSKASSNNKEASDLKKLKCDKGVRSDGVARYICTSSEFAQALTSSGRLWKTKRYRYSFIEINDTAGTCLLLIQKP
jgi:hypothetical protein